jgi:N-hydroxyarylamine O-acetyltransferase
MHRLTHRRQPCLASGAQPRAMWNVKEEGQRAMNAPATTDSLDPAAYLDRIQLATHLRWDTLAPTLESLRALHVAHLLAVPFENLSIHYGQPITLGDAALYEKIVRQHRGGFCYELNGLFAWLLLRLGFTVSRLSAGVADADGGFSPAFDHMTLRIHDLEGTDWLADVGFGDSFRQPLRLQPDIEQDGGDGHSYRLTARGSTWLLQQSGETSWEPQYRFTLQPYALTDFAERCQYQQTSPESHFTQRRICTLALPTGRVTLSDLKLITTLDGHRQERVLESEREYRAVLAERFGITIGDV